jgi:hypothetical protein
MKSGPQLEKLPHNAALAGGDRRKRLSHQEIVAAREEIWRTLH